MIHAKVTRNNDNSIHLIRIEITEESIDQFKQLVDRALNCWNSAPADLKSLGDLLTHGYVTQKYEEMNQPINTKQNTDMYTIEETRIIEYYVMDYGVAAWKARVLNRTTGAVLKGTAKD